MSELNTIITSEHYHISGKNFYILSGKWPHGAKAEVFWNKRPSETKAVFYPVVPEKASDNQDRSRKSFSMGIPLPELLKPQDLIEVYAVIGEERSCIWNKTGSELLMMQRCPQYYIDSAEKIENTCTIKGWCAAPSEISVDAKSPDGSIKDSILKQFIRPDVAAVYSEIDITPDAGFILTIPSVSENAVKISFSCNEGSADQTVFFDKASSQTDAISNLAEKSFTYVKKNGIGSIARKVLSKLKKGDAGSNDKNQRAEQPVQKKEGLHYLSAPIVSIVFPFYKTSEDFLKEFIRTAFIHTDASWELVVSCSTEDTPLVNDILNEYTDVMARTLLVKMDNGKSHAQNIKDTIEASTGELVVTACHDDEGTLQELFGYINELNAVSDIDKRKECLIDNMCRKDDRSVLLAIDHNIGGGATSYLQNKFAEYEENEWKPGVIRYNATRKNYYTLLQGLNCSVMACDASLEKLLSLFHRVDEIWINELVTYPDLSETMNTILSFRDRVDAKLCFKLHDFFCICPAVTLVDEKFKYCDIAEPARCNECILTNENALPGGFTDVGEFRNAFEHFLKECDIITAFSQSSADILKRAYPSLEKVEIIPHKTTPLDKPNLGEKTTDTFNIGILGAINENKGRIIIDECVEEIERTGRKDHICLIGYANKEYESPAITVTGPYKRDEVSRLVEENDIDVFIIPSIWPETFSYTSSEIMSMEIPLAVFNLGAPPERVKNYDKGLILESYEGAGKLLDSLEELGHRFR